MNIKQRLEADIKSALLAGQKELVTVLRTLKSVILYAEVATNKRQEGLSEAEHIALLSKEVKKRQDAADLYISVGESERAANELNELKIIAEYLPVQMSDEELNSLVDVAIAEQAEPMSQKLMGKVIAVVREKSDGRADGSRIATAVKTRIITE